MPPPAEEPASAAARVVHQADAISAAYQVRLAAWSATVQTPRDPHQHLLPPHPHGLHLGWGRPHGDLRPRSPTDPTRLRCPYPADDDAARGAV